MNQVQHKPKIWLVITVCEGKTTYHSVVLKLILHNCKKISHQVITKSYYLEYLLYLKILKPFEILNITKTSKPTVWTLHADCFLTHLKDSRTWTLKAWSESIWFIFLKLRRSAIMASAGVEMLGLKVNADYVKDVVNGSYFSYHFICTPRVGKQLRQTCLCWFISHYSHHKWQGLEKKY